MRGVNSSNNAILNKKKGISEAKMICPMSAGQKLSNKYNESERLRYPKGHLWSRGKFASSVGFVQLETIQNYVRNQDLHHGNRTL